MKNIVAFSLLLLATISILSCQKDEQNFVAPTENSYPNVDPSLWSYFQDFEEEAAARGLRVDLVDFGVTAEIQELSEQNVAGQCTYGSAIGSEIIIDQGFWNDFPSRQIREMVIFHELGHCYLHRGHTEGAHADGTCISIMRSGLENCQDNYNALTRDEYLDELFSVSNP